MKTIELVGCIQSVIFKRKERPKTCVTDVQLQASMGAYDFKFHAAHLPT